MKKHFTNTVSDKLAIPVETLSETPFVILRGKRRLCIENHRGVTQYEDTLVQVAVKHGSIRVVGFGLSIASMSKDTLEICGTIRAVELE